ncbi:MAG: hypothetical protein KA122_11855 [Verrucomicrobia bacterium]|nr:hypothetical protein [Verrucomicrobiota bacterium]
MNSPVWQWVLRAAVLVVVAGGVGWWGFRCLKRSDDPARLAFKWGLSALLLGVLVFWGFPAVGEGRIHPMLGVPLVAAVGLVLAIIWGRSIGLWAARPLSSLYDGGQEEPAPQPVYSRAQSLQKKGRYAEAAREIWRQLERFPTDREGQMLLAQIQAEDLKDLAAAELTLTRFCAQPGHAPANLAFALFSLADWHLRLAQDRAAAQRVLEQVIARLPDSEFARAAAHRIAHLDHLEMRLAPHEPKKFTVVAGPTNIGLRSRGEPDPPAADDGEQEVAKWVRHLTQHPLDTEARERLAILYADCCGRLDLATAELEQLIALPNLPEKQAAHWLNRLADLQIRTGAGEEAIRQTLHRIEARAPQSVHAELARQRLARLKLELKAGAATPTVKLGVYEQNLGLKRDLPRR